MAPSSWFKHFWTHVKEGRPGHRFQDHYHHAREAHGRSAMWKRALKIVGGTLAILIGIVEIVFPGPAFLFLIVGGAMLATESLRIARIMDWCELRVHRLWTCLRRRWRRAQPSS